MQKWEYLYVTIAYKLINKTTSVMIVSAVNDQNADYKNHTLFSEYCNQLGTAGWELAGVGGYNTTVLFFKRPIP
jgi:hypothetical protein